MTFAKSIQLTSVCIANAFGDPILLADPERPAAPRFWSLCMTSENHGTVGPAGCKFTHAPDKHERVLVVEVPAGSRAPVAEFKGYVDGEPAVTWFDRDNMPRVGTKLFAAPIEGQAGQVASLESQAAEIERLRAELEKMWKARFMISQALHNTMVGNQSAWIEWQHGAGAEEAMAWIHNGLVGPGLIPDGKDAQPWYDANQDDRYEVPACAALSTATQASTPGEPKCSCPSGDGSLRWPCNVHPPEALASTSGERQEGGKS